MNANPASFFFFCRILSYMERKEKSSGEKRENPDSRLFDCGSPAEDLPVFFDMIRHISTFFTRFGREKCRNKWKSSENDNQYNCIK